MKRLACIAAAAVGVLLAASQANADDLADASAIQYAYMELCKDSPPLPADRIRAVDAEREIVDETELRKAITRLTVNLAGGKDKIARFCSIMTDTIAHETGHEK
jgi:hypothetical protein